MGIKFRRIHHVGRINAFPGFPAYFVYLLSEYLHTRIYKSATAIAEVRHIDGISFAPIIIHHLVGLSVSLI